MTGAVYLGALLVSLACMALLDRRVRLVLWQDARRGALVLAIGIAFFLAWDVAAIASGHYRMGAGEAMTGIVVAPELPVEELVFVTFLCYHTLVLRGLIGILLGRRWGAGGPAPDRRRTARTPSAASVRTGAGRSVSPEVRP